MRYLSLDLEATGLDEHDLVIEIGFVPIDALTRSIESSLATRYFIQCPSFEDLSPKLSDWVKKNNRSLIECAHREGLALEKFRETFQTYLQSKPVKDYFGGEKIILFGKSMNAIDLPFLTRDFGQEFMREHFSHRILDVSSAAYTMIDAGVLPPECERGSVLSKTFGIPEVAHTALEDAVNTAKIYFKMIDQLANVGR